MAVKLPLAVRKDVRDSWESVLPSYQERVKKCLGEEYTLDPNIEGLYAATVETDRASQVGRIAANYYDQFLSGLESLTDKGKDREAAALFNSLVPTKRVTLVFDKEPFNYCGSRFINDEYQLVVHPEHLYVNTSYVVEHLARWVDMALFKQKGELPLTTRRGEREYTEPAIKAAQAKFKKMFGEDYTFSYSLLEAYKARHSKWEDSERVEEDWFRSYGSTHVPNMIGEYFQDVANGLEYKKYGADDMLQEAFKEATETKIVEFKFKDSLPSGEYSAVEFVDGKFIVFTTVDRFGINMSTSVVDKVIDML